MSLRPQEIVRSEVEGGLSGPANSLTAESIDCGCARYRLPGLVKFATRRLFLILLCSIGILQAAVQAYFYVTSSTIAKAYQIDTYVMEWVLYMSDVAPVIVGLAVAYWGDRIHRAAWLGGLTLVQCGGILACIIPHLSNSSQLIEKSEYTTHMSIFAEEKPELCTKTSLKLIAKEDVPQYSTLLILIIMQMVTGMANVAYYALGISYLDDNTKKEHVSVYFGAVIAVKILGSIFGYILGWSFLRIDANDFSPLKSYRYQVGAWWLGWPIFAILLAIPSILMAIFPRKLPSEMVEQAAATILDQSGTLRGSQKITAKKVGSTHFIPSMLRLITNKILICNVLAMALLVTALTNFFVNENIFLESRFYAPRPIGTLFGFGDPLFSRIITTITKPILVGLIIIIAGLVIGRSKPKARMLIGYTLVILIVSALIIFGLAFNNCDKAPIVGYHKGSFSLIKRHCNINCQCPQNSNFQPVCDSRGTFTFYSPCYAGCESVEYENNNKIYFNCSCVGEKTGLGNHEAVEGPCGSNNCQIGWLLYEILSMLVYAAVASTVIGDLLISLRSVNVQDKALTIGYSLTLLGFLSYIPGKIGYDEIIKSTCIKWNVHDKMCSFYHPVNLGNYLCFLTAGLILLSASFKVVVWLLCENLEIYDSVEESQQPTEMKDISETQVEPLLQICPRPVQEESNQSATVDSTEAVIESKHLGKANGPVADQNEGESSGSRLKYGPVGPGDRRSTYNQSNPNILHASTDDDLDSSDGSQEPRKNSQVSYKPLEIDSDAESDISGAAAKSKKVISNSTLNELSKPLQRIQPLSNKRFPNPDNYEDPRLIRSSRTNSPSSIPDGSSRTNSFEYTRQRKDNEPISASRGDFNEIGIPLVESYETTVKGSTNSLRSPTIMMAMQQLDRHPSELFENTHFVYKFKKNDNSKEIEENRKFRLEKLMQPVDYSPMAMRPPSRDQASSGFGSLQDMREKMRLHSDVSDSRDSLSSKSSEQPKPPKKGSPLCTDL